MSKDISFIKFVKNSSFASLYFSDKIVSSSSFRIVYERVPHHRTQAVFVLSAFWHGFYPGYYMAFATCGLMVEAARKVSSII